MYTCIYITHKHKHTHRDTQRHTHLQRAEAEGEGAVWQDLRLTSLLEHHSVARR